MTGRDPAAVRFAVIQLVRLAGVAAVLAGIAIQTRRLEPLAGVPLWVGYALIAAGLIGFFVVPLRLARRWRSARP